MIEEVAIVIGVIWLVLTLGFVLGWITRLLFGRNKEKGTGQGSDLRLLKSEKPDVIDLREVDAEVDGKRRSRRDDDDQDPRESE